MGIFSRAVKHDAKLRLAIAGPSGSGKTWTSLTIATSLAPGKVALVDTEHGSASKYAREFDFSVMEMEAPYHPNRVVECIQAAADAGFKAIVIDSLTHFWSGEGGMLDLVSQIADAKYRGNSFAAWKDATPIQNEMINGMLTADIHVIVTMRSKVEYVLEEDDKGKKTPRKMGMAPEQRQNFEYEMDVVMEMDVTNRGVITKTRCSALSGKSFSKPGAPMAKILAEWLKGDAPAPQPQAAPNATEGHSDYPGDLESELLDSWVTPADAQAWAVSVGACVNIHEARNSFANLVKEEFGGKCTTANLKQVLWAYMQKQDAKLEELFEATQDEQEAQPQPSAGVVA